MSTYVLADFTPLWTDVKLAYYLTSKITNDLDCLGLGQLYSIVGRSLGTNGCYDCVSLAVLDFPYSKFLGMKVELHPSISQILSER